MKRCTQKVLFIILLPWIFIQGQTVSDVLNLIRDGQINQARETLKRIETNSQNLERILFLRGLLCTEGDSAVTYYEQLLKSYPDSPYSDDALFRLGQCKYAQGLYMTAKKQFQRFLRLQLIHHTLLTSLQTHIDIV